MIADTANLASWAHLFGAQPEARTGFPRETRVVIQQVWHRLAPRHGCIGDLCNQSPHHVSVHEHHLSPAAGIVLDPDHCLLVNIRVGDHNKGHLFTINPILLKTPCHLIW